MPKRGIGGFSGALLGGMRGSRGGIREGSDKGFGQGFGKEGKDLASSRRICVPGLARHPR